MMMKAKFPPTKSRTLLSLAVAAAVGGTTLTSQAKEFVLDEIVVTAQKRTESLQDVSVSVSAVGAGFMQDAGITDMVDVAQHVASLTVSTNSNPWNTSFRMRRIGNEGNIPTFEPDTGLFIDGAFRSQSGLGLGDLVDIQRIEALKGPQSTLYGKNVTAGVISVTTAAPSQDLSVMVEATAAEDSAYNLKGYINGGLTDTVAGRVSFSYSERDHLVDNVSTGGDADELQSYSLRGQLLIEPSDEMSIRLIAGAVKRDFDGPVGDVEWGTTAQTVAAAMTGLFGAGAPIQENTLGNRKIEYGQGVNEFKQDSYEFSAIVEYDMAGFSLTSITSYDEYDVENYLVDTDQLAADILALNDTREGHSWSQELRLTSPGGETIDWMTGLYVYHNNFKRMDGDDRDFILGSDINALSLVATGGATPNALGQPGESVDLYNEQNTDTYGMFASATWNITDQMALTGGLRYSYEKKDAEISNVSNGTGAIFNGAIVPGGTWSWEPNDDWDQATGNLNLEYHWNDDAMTYLTAAHGYKAGGYNLGWGATPNADRPFGEEKVDTIELGWKTHLLGSRLQFNGAVFYTEYSDFQSAAFKGLTFEVSNAEQVNNMGIEFDGLFLVTENITVNFAASYVKAEYDEYTKGSCAFGVTPNGPEAANGFCDLSGEDLPFAPRWKASAGIQYETDLAGGDFYARTDVSWVDDHIPSSSLDERHEQSDYATANVKLGWRNENWDFSIWGKNITNQDYAIQYAPDNVIGALLAPGMPGGDGSQQVFLNAPASAGATARYIY